MEQYIPKSVVLTEIEKLMGNPELIEDWRYRVKMEEKNELLKSIINTIDTLEVKEVEEGDLETSIDDYINSHFTEGCDGGMISDWYKVLGGVHYKDLKELAKHFFELGLQARTDKELVEEVYSHIDSIKDTADRMTSGNFMHNRAAIKFSANTIAKVLELMGLKAQKGE